MEEAVVQLLDGLGAYKHHGKEVDETPRRVVAALKELTSGYSENVDSYFKTFETSAVDQIVCLKGIPFYSLCAHHMLPFSGKISIAYIPQKRIIGLSKLARVANAYARRLQVQEHLTQEIADKIWQKLKPKGVAVVVEGEHFCMRMRGIKSEGKMQTSVMLGAFRKDAKAREEFFSLIK